MVESTKEGNGYLFIWFGRNKPLTIQSRVTDDVEADFVLDVLERLKKLHKDQADARPTTEPAKEEES